MPLIHMIAVLVVIGVAVWAINTYLAAYIDPTILKILHVAIVIGVILWLLSVFGLFDAASGVYVGPRR